MLNRRPGKRRALNAVLVNSMGMLVWLHVNSVRKTRITATKEETALASIVPRGGRPPAGVLDAKHVERVPMAMDVNPVPKGNTATAVTQLWSPAGIAQRVITTTTSGKDHVCHVFL